MSGDVRSLEEVIAAADPNPKYVKEIAAAVREWCLAPEQIERAAKALWEQQNPVEAMDDDAWDKLHRGDQTVAWHDALAVLHAVIGDTP